MNAHAPPPISWLVLEQYALGELPEARRREVEAQLAHSPEDRAALAEIEADRSELPALPDFVKLPALPERIPTADVIPMAPRRARRGVGWAVTSALAVAAAVLLARIDRTELPPARRHLKGGDLALRVISESGAQATTFAEGERLKLQVTCPPHLAGALSVAVFQAGERYAPLPEAPDFACGNLTPWPGAFQLDGEAPAHVCVAPAVALHDADHPSELGSQSVCLTLRSR